MEIGLLRHIKSTKIEFEVAAGNFRVVGDDFVAAELKVGEKVILETNTNNRVRAVLADGQTLGSYQQIELLGDQVSDVLILNNITPKDKKREYRGSFRVSNPNSLLRIVNLVSIEHYLAGVVESEGGPGHTLTYYMVQAIMSRTYALKYKNRHAKDGFHLCDQVHCQAYHQREMRSPDILKAVVQTDGMVLMDSQKKLLDAFFFANCGGQTCDASHVWNNSISYLEPFKDTFCVHTKQARWTKKITKEEWLNFLINNYDYPMSDFVYRSQVFHFIQEERKAFFVSPELGIPLRDIRQQFKLKSTFFHVYEHENHVVLEGRGYGHGVGLCQEGAMEMAKRGYHFSQILRYYFSGAFISILEKSDYFKHAEKEVEGF
jgi:stage II sporulation protein D